MAKHYWLAKVSQGAASFASAKSAAEILFETEDVYSPLPHQVFKAIEDLKIISSPPPIYIVIPIHGVSDSLLQVDPDWSSDGMKAWFFSRAGDS
jgi:hypothetical protein